MFSEKGTLVQPDAVDEIVAKQNPEDYVRRLTGREEMPLFLDREFLQKLDGMQGGPVPIVPPIQPDILPAVRIPPTPKEAAHSPELPLPTSHFPPPTSHLPLPTSEIHAMHSPSSFSPVARDYEADVRIIKDVTGNLSSTGSIQDFVTYFKDRYAKVKALLREKPSLSGAAPIASLKRLKSAEEVKLIGMVSESRITKNGHCMVTFEDETGTINALASKNDGKMLAIASTLVKDEVVGVAGKFAGDGDLFIIKDVMRPDVPNNKTDHRSEAPVYAAFISDVHVGSNTFLKKEWQSFVSWLNGNSPSVREREIIGRIKYLVVSGDLVDGIGIYPRQEEELEIRDIYAQYEEFARMVDEIPEYVHIILQPGNHDAVRLAEPQPAFPDEIKKLFKRGNITFVGNPAYFSLHGVEVLSYHGRSMDDLIPALKLSWHDPISVMKNILHRRHLAPIYGGKNQLAPESTDYMVIDSIPDIFVTGHVHVSGID
ncbi:MAG: DNA polymerase II, partial [Thermoplasmata archaeon HGW-Thermoplasmata-2]